MTTSNKAHQKIALRLLEFFFFSFSVEAWWDLYQHKANLWTLFYRFRLSYKTTCAAIYFQNIKYRRRMLHFFLALPMILVHLYSTRISFYVWTFRLFQFLCSFCCSKLYRTSTPMLILYKLEFFTFPRCFFKWILRIFRLFRLEDTVVLFEVFLLSLGSLHSLPLFLLIIVTDFCSSVCELESVNGVVYLFVYHTKCRDGSYKQKFYL